MLRSIGKQLQKNWSRSLKQDLEAGTKPNASARMVAEVIRHKARLVAKGYSQRHSIDYDETYVPVAYLNSIRMKLAKCCAEGFEIELSDVNTAFQYRKLEEEIYMELPEGLRKLLSSVETEREDDVVYLLLLRLYGLKQASRVWNENIDAHLKSMGFKAADADPCIYTRGRGDGERAGCLYVDDMLIASRENAPVDDPKSSEAKAAPTSSPAKNLALDESPGSPIPEPPIAKGYRSLFDSESDEAEKEGTITETQAISNDLDQQQERYQPAQLQGAPEVSSSAPPTLVYPRGYIHRMRGLGLPCS
ncbi:Retrotransposon protein, unclassified [Phytophthora palmivora]|uniref:Retrotransposon protein, unclassified n=1 Tax=Phytophthora palmivora TaxID=4796 RepID=A0A2P4XN22_9STRA|nr:Retrotransposon protein, unclassified [Phytophthora palmivora]